MVIIKLTVNDSEHAWSIKNKLIEALVDTPGQI